MASIFDDIERQIDKEEALAQQRKAQEAQEKAKAAAKAAEAQKRRNDNSLFF
jgi:hypothetical protein